MTADTSLEAQSPPSLVPSTVRRQDRAVDAAAAICLAVGVALFAMGRRALSSLADGTYPAPLGESWVARADLHAAQTRWGIILIAVGVSVALVSAIRHAVHRRTRER
ncbi:MAG: hypothetical protein ABI910_12865 [Gemmatimonadota bacterium]